MKKSQYYIVQVTVEEKNEALLDRVPGMIEGHLGLIDYPNPVFVTAVPAESTVVCKNQVFWADLDN